ncbi:unnamed protein product [Effrenium voratum]|nr:unnamed protein product [Effrenium voratum]
MDLEILGAISGELFHCLKASELRQLEQVSDLKLAISRAKGLQSPSMIRLYDHQALVQDDLSLPELWRRQGSLKALVVILEDDQDLDERLPALLQLPLQDVQGLRGLLQRALERKAQVMRDLPQELQADRSLVFSAVAKNWKVLKFCSADFQDDLDIVQQAVLQNTTALQFASTRLRGHRGLVMQAISLNTAVLQFATTELREDVQLMKEALRRNPFALRFASQKLAEHKDGWS